ncbi:hypothetical protein L3Y34_019141 [Caenorhabditis briggsae]|uniref:Uncharacterized protein n=1 Tax=Caenorhabditis briggsae TaxID=6238 RepID=A0AAE9IWA4_CAEBR|nr:hypothetical protein L3Y34_019141 [Caenorhabditis briggsae]
MGSTMKTFSRHLKSFFKLPKLELDFNKCFANDLLLAEIKNSKPAEVVEHLTNQPIEIRRITKGTFRTSDQPTPTPAP